MSADGAAGHHGFVMYVGDDHSIFQAAFAGAQDFPDEIAAWALEMARRQPMRADLAGKLRAHRQEQGAEHRGLCKNLAELTANATGTTIPMRMVNASVSIFGPSDPASQAVATDGLQHSSAQRQEDR